MNVEPLLNYVELNRCHSIREERRKKEEEDEEARKKEEEARKRAEEEAEEAARLAREAARLAKEAEEEAARLEMEAEEEAFRRKKEAEEEAAEWSAREEARLRQAERVNKEPETQEEPEAPVAAERTLDESRHWDKVPVQDKEEQREEVEDGEAAASSPPEKVEKGKASAVSQPDKGNSTQAEAGPQLEEESQAVEEQEEAHSEEEGTTEAAASHSPERDKGAQAAAEASPSTDPQSGQKKLRPPTLHKVPASRSQEKRELRRQRGLEHSQRESKRVASAVTKEEPAPKVIDQEAASRAEGKPKGRPERTDSKEMDQYTFVAWKKEDKGKKEAKAATTPAPIRPSTLPLNPPEPMANRNGHEVLGPGNLTRYSQQDAMKEKAEKWKGRKIDVQQPESTSPPEAHSKDRIKKYSQYDISCSS